MAAAGEGGAAGLAMTVTTWAGDSLLLTDLPLSSVFGRSAALGVTLGVGVTFPAAAESRRPLGLALGTGDASILAVKCELGEWPLDDVSSQAPLPIPAPAPPLPGVCLLEGGPGEGSGDEAGVVTEDAVRCSLALLCGVRATLPALETMTASFRTLHAASSVTLATSSAARTAPSITATHLDVIWQKIQLLRKVSKSVGHAVETNRLASKVGSESVPTCCGLFLNV